MATATKNSLKGYEPVGDRVLVLAEDPETVTLGGILLPESAAEKTYKIGKILAVGQGEFCKNVKVGDRVYFNSFTHHDLEIEGTLYGLVDGEDIRCKLPK